MTAKNSYIFLDFDGVVNTENYQMRLTRSNKQKKDKYSPVSDSDTVRRLGRIINTTGAIHILSSKNSAKCFNSSESFKSELEDSFGEDFRKLQGTILDDDEDLEEKERMIELKDASRLYGTMMEEMSDEEIDYDEYGICVEDLDCDDFWGDIEECKDEDEDNEINREILESFMEDTSDEILHSGNYSKTSPYSEQDD